MSAAKSIPLVLASTKANDMNDTVSNRDVVRSAISAISAMALIIVGLCGYIVVDTKASTDKSLNAMSQSIDKSLERVEAAAVARDKATNDSITSKFEILISMMKR